jgi:flagellar biosynthesis protein FlhF
MRLKSFFAENVSSALSRARRELGSEAILVHSRKAPPEARHLGECEVVVAAPPQLPAAAEANPRDLSGEMAELRREVERMATAVARSSVLCSARNLPSGKLARAFTALVTSEVDAELAHDLVSQLRAAGVADTREQIRRALAAELEKRFQVDGRLGRGAEGPRMVALVGPCGAGKTMTLVKLAVQYGLTARRPTQLISMDNFRTAAAEQLRAYATILGVGFQSLETVGALAQALEEHRHKELILIDTAGHGPRDLDGSADLARFLATHPTLDTHLVLTASMKSADLSHAADRFEVFRPRKLLFTKLDETETFGPLVNEAVRTGKPISFLASGQRIPEDLEAATAKRVVELVLNGK